MSTNKPPFHQNDYQKASPTTKKSPLFASSNHFQIPFRTLYSQGSDPLRRTSFQDHLTIYLHTLYSILTAPHSIQDHLKISLHKLALYAPNLQIYSPSNTRLLSPLAKFPNLHLQGPVTNSVKSIENFYCTTIQCEREHEEFHIMSLNTLVFLLISTTIMLVETNDGYY